MSSNDSDVCDTAVWFDFSCQISVFPMTKFTSIRNSHELSVNTFSEIEAICPTVYTTGFKYLRSCFNSFWS
jgi:hypothetical protein